MGEVDIALRHLSTRYGDVLAATYGDTARPTTVSGWTDSQVTWSERRLDKAISVIEKLAESSADPVEDPRPQVAGMVAGGLGFFALIIWIIALRSMSKRSSGDSKEHLLDNEAEWTIPAA